MATAAKIAKPKKADLARWDEIQTKLAALKRETDAFRREQKLLEEKCEAYARQETKGPLPRELTLFGHVLRIVAKANPVKWKDEVIAALGAERAVELQEAAGESETFKIEAVS